MIRTAATALVLAGAMGLDPGPPPASPCDGPDADPWVTDFRDRVADHSGLARFAAEAYGAPLVCEGSVTSDFDGASFGVLTLTYPDGVSLTVETMPPETSVTTLSAPRGFRDADKARQALEAYTAAVGVAVDWTTPEVTTEGPLVTRRFWDPDPGLNASASLVFRGDMLVAVGFSMAL